MYLKMYLKIITCFFNAVQTVLQIFLVLKKLTIYYNKYKYAFT